jgi:hypothetical protein
MHQRLTALQRDEPDPAPIGSCPCCRRSPLNRTPRLLLGLWVRKKDIVFEVFHNFVALSQWRKAIFGIMSRLAEDGWDAEVRAAFTKTISGDYDNAKGEPCTPLQLLIMELFRTISPNGGSISAIQDARNTAYGFFVLPAPRLSFRARQLHEYAAYRDQLRPEAPEKPAAGDPDRYRSVPTSARIDEDRCRQLGFARCPFDITTWPVSDGRKAGLTNSGFGTVFGVVEGKPLPVCDYAGFAPFGFGYRRCPGEQLTIDVFADFLRKGLARQDHLPQAQPAQAGERPDRAERGDRR